jgi:hypothetical protein
MPGKSKSVVPIEQIDGMIHTIRGVRVMLDRDLAQIYGVPTKAFNQAVKRNRPRFPEDFMFRLTQEEAKALQVSKSRTVTLKRGQNIKYLPYAFTEYGALMAANILNSPRAVQMNTTCGDAVGWTALSVWETGERLGRARVNVFVVRAFAKMREALRGTPELARKLAALEKKLTARLDVHEAAIVQVLREVMQILNPPLEPEPPRRRIGFHES